jgi:hypothetical protein
MHERFEVDHVPVGRFLSRSPVHEDGDVTIMSVMEEVTCQTPTFLKEEALIRKFWLDRDRPRQPRPLTSFTETKHD